jgi:hypothetical protein
MLRQVAWLALWASASAMEVSMRWLRMAWLPVAPVRPLVLAGASCGPARTWAGPGLPDRAFQPSHVPPSPIALSLAVPPSAGRVLRPGMSDELDPSALRYLALGAGHGGEQRHAGKMARRGHTARGGWLPGLPPAQNLGRVALAPGQPPPRALFAVVTRCMFRRTSCTDLTHWTLPDRNRTGNHEPLSSPPLGGPALAGEGQGPSLSLTRTRAAVVRPQIIQQGRFPEDSHSS